MARTDYGAILSTVIKDTSDAIRLRENNSTLVAPKDWDREIKKLELMPTCNASGSMVSFDYGKAQAPLTNVVAEIKATQSGSGDPYPAGGGKNKFDKSEFQNLKTNYEYVDSSYYCRAIQLLPNTTYTVSQNAGSTSSVIILINVTSHVNDAGFLDLRKASDVKTFTTDDSGKLYIGVFSNYNNTQYNERLEQCKVQIEAGSSATDYAPYSNIRPITGVSSVNVTRTGKNLFDITKMSDRSGVTVSGNTFSGLARSFTSSGLVTPFFAKSGSVLTVQATTKSNGVVTSGAGFALLFVYADNTTVRPWYTNNNETSETHHTGTVTATSDIVGYRFVDYNSGTDNTWTVKDFQIEFGSTVSDYSAYQGNTYLIQLGDTYYGATLDVVSGKLRVTHWLDEYDGSNDETWSFYSSSGLRYSYYTNRSHTQPAISSVDKWKSNSIPVSGSSENTPEDANRITCRGTFYSSKNLYIFAPPTDIPDITALRSYLNNQPLQFWYPITPIEIDLTPMELSELEGQNNVWVDSGDLLSLTYRQSNLVNYITETASGAVASFSDGANDIPLKELSLSINPTQSGSGDPAPDNIRPITGVSSVNVYRTGKNVVQTITNWTSVAYVEKYTNWSGGMIGGYPRLTGYWKAGTYTFSMDIELAAVNNRVIMIFKKASDQNWYYINSNNVFVPSTNADKSTKPFTTESTGETTKHIVGTITIPEDVDEIRLGYYDYNNRYRYYNLMVELGSTASDYSAYQGNTYTIALGDTYYGATLDVVSGKLRLKYVKTVVDKTMLKSYNSRNMVFAATSGGKRMVRMRSFLYYTETGAKEGYYCRAIKWAGEIFCISNIFSNIHINNRGYMASQTWTDFIVPDTVTDYASWQSFIQDLIDNNVDVEFCYEYSTADTGYPTEVQLSPTQINSLLGQNNIWHDGNGDVESLKFMDRQLYFGR